ncbi:MAG: SET domain-containing protein [Saprospiraceae bacterium]|jgi:SET domain-containing protein
MQQIPGLFIAPDEYGGRGIFTANDIEKGSMIEIAPVLVIPKAQVKIIHGTVLHDYYFRWGREFDKCAIALGFGSLYNHSYVPNMAFEMDFSADTLTFHARINIAAGEELTFNYNGDFDDKTPLWFTKKQ